MTYLIDCDREQNQRERNSLAYVEDNPVSKEELEAQLEQVTAERDKLQREKEELQKQLNYLKCQDVEILIALQPYPLESSSGNIQKRGEADGLKGLQLRMPQFAMYNLGWQKGFIKFMESGAFFKQQCDNFFTDVPF